MTLTSFILWINVSIFSSRNGFLEIFNIENVQKYMLKLLIWIKVAAIMIPKKLSRAPAGYKDCTWPLLNFYIPTKVSHPYQVWNPGFPS